MPVDLRVPAFSFVALCQVHVATRLPSGTPCELHYAGGPEDLDRDVRAYVVGQESASAGEDVGVLLGFLRPEAHRDRLNQGVRVDLKRGDQLVASGEVVVCGRRE
jgi:hypothetical protein